MLFTVKSEMKSLVYLSQGFLLIGNEKFAKRAFHCRCLFHVSKQHAANNNG